MRVLDYDTTGHADQQQILEKGLTLLSEQFRPCPTLPADAEDTMQPDPMALREDLAAPLPVKHGALAG